MPSALTSGLADKRFPHSIDALLSKELQQLSFQERETIQEEIHGIPSGNARVETPEMIKGALGLFANELDHFIPNHIKKAYYQALRDFPDTTYLKDHDFWLRFLRCEQFDVKKAANRMVHFLDLILDEFGPELLRRPLTLEVVSTNKEDRELLQSGMFSLLPLKDRSGRIVLSAVGEVGLNFNNWRRKRIVIYLLWAATEDAESQSNGMVIIVWPSPISSSLSLEETNTPELAQLDEAFCNTNSSAPLHSGTIDHLKRDATIFSCLPIRIVAFHCCSFPDNILFQLFKAYLATIMGPTKVKMRNHSGSPIEIRYVLLSFGIPSDLIGMTDTGHVKNKNHLQWIQTRMVLEQSLTPMDVALQPIEFPHHHDVLFRHGQSYSFHPGNTRYRDVIASNFERHRNASKEEKVSITWEVVSKIEVHGRFLTWNRKNGWWVEMIEPDAKRSRIAVAFKEHSKKLKQKSNIQSSESSTSGFAPASKKQKTEDGHCGCF